jgi:uncharacterized membrane protein
MKQWYYAKDGQKFGPFQESHMQELYQKGEISPSDLVWEEGTADWIPASQSVLQTTPAPATGADDRLHPFSCIGRGWKLVWQHPLQLIGGILIAVITIIISSSPSLLGSFMMNPVLSKNLPGVGLIIYAAGLIISLIACPLLVGGVLQLFLRTIRTGAPNLADLFYPFKNITRIGVPLLLAHLLAGILITLGLICLIIPGIWLAISYMFTKTAIVDTQPGIWRALEHSRRLVAGNWWRTLGLWLLISIINLLGYLPCGLGLIITMPVTAAAFVYAYEDLRKLKK